MNEWKVMNLKEPKIMRRQKKGKNEINIKEGNNNERKKNAKKKNSRIIKISHVWLIATKYAIGHISIVDIRGIVVEKRWPA